MTSDLDLRGVWVPLITPFDAQGAVDVEAIERLCDEYLAAGVSGIVALGTTGEASSLDADEKQAVIDAVARVCAAARQPRHRRHRLEQHRGTRSRPPRRSPARPASSARSSSCRTTCGRRSSGDRRALPAVAAASPVPVIVYNIPARTGRDLGAAGAARARAHVRTSRA